MPEPRDLLAMRNPQMVKLPDSRFRLAMIGRHHMVDVLRGRARFTNLPEDAELIRWVTPYEIDGFAIVVRSATFDEVKHGERIPDLWLTFENITAEEFEARARAMGNPWPPPKALEP